MQYAPFIAITSAASTALIFGLLGTLTLPACVMVTLAPARLLEARSLQSSKCNVSPKIRDSALKYRFSELPDPAGSTFSGKD